MRRYSTYGNSAPRNITKRQDVTTRKRRSNVDDRTRLLKMNIEQDENDSVATTLTSLTHTKDLSRTRVNRGKISDRTNKSINQTSLQSNHRVSASFSKPKTRAKTKPKSSTCSNASEAHASKSHDGTKKYEKQNHSRARNTYNTGERLRGLHTDEGKEWTSRAPTFLEGGTLEPPSVSSHVTQSGGVTTVVCATSRQGCYIPSNNSEHGITIAQLESKNETQVAHVLQSEIQTPREETNTPLTITREAFLIAEEVLGGLS